MSLREARVILVGALLSGVFAVTGIAITVADETAPAQPVDCQVMVEKAGRLAKNDKGTAWLYGRPGHDPELPSLATSRQIKACGRGPEDVLEKQVDEGLLQKPRERR